MARDPGAIGDVSWVELFVDLLFVFAFLAVTTLMGEHFTLLGLTQGVLVVLLLWHCWTPCVWLGNVVHLDRGVMPPIMLGIAAALLVIGVAIPEAFTDRQGGLPGPLVLICGYLLIRATAMVILTFVRHRGEGDRRSVVTAWLIFIVGGLVLLGSALLPPLLPATVDAAPVQLALFASALGIDSLILVVASKGGWQVVSPWHLAERHALIVLIALGETIISIGASEGLGIDRPVTAQLAVGAVLGIIVVFALWWSYFDLAKVIIERALRASAGADRARVGRDVYSGLHLPMIGGLILFALGLKHLSTHSMPKSAHPWPSAGVTILYGGVLLYLAALVAVEWRAVRLLGRGPLVGVALLLALQPVVERISEVQALVVLVAAICTMVALDNTVFRQRHRQLHESVEGEGTEVGAVDPRGLFVDLVFVYAFIEVTAVMNRFPTLLGLAQGMILLALLWWAWTSYTWLANAVRHDSTVVRLSTAGIMTAVLLIGLAIPQAFVPLPGSLPGPLLVIGCYVFIQLMQGLIFRQIVRENSDLRGAGSRFAGTAITIVILMVIAGVEVVAPDRVARHPAMTLLWAAALLVQYVAGYWAGNRLWRIRLRPPLGGPPRPGHVDRLRRSGPLRRRRHRRRTDLRAHPGRRRRVRGGPRHHLVELLHRHRRGQDRARGLPGGPPGTCRAGCVHLSAPADGGGHRPGRLRPAPDPCRVPGPRQRPPGPLHAVPRRGVVPVQQPDVLAADLPHHQPPPAHRRGGGHRTGAG